jgi:hypothetical protein
MIQRILTNLIPKPSQALILLLTHGNGRECSVRRARRQVIITAHKAVKKLAPCIRCRLSAVIEWQKACPEIWRRPQQPLTGTTPCSTLFQLHHLPDDLPLSINPLLSDVTSKRLTSMSRNEAPSLLSPLALPGLHDPHR